MNINEYDVKLQNIDIPTIKQRLENYISSDDLLKYFGEMINDKIVKYSDLDNYKTIEQLLPDNNDFKIILIENQLNSGHWVVILRYDNTIEFFNSYGLMPSVDLNFIDNLQNKMLGQDIKFLNILLNECKNRFNIIYNKKRFQKLQPNINTCGRWCILRIIMFQYFQLDLYKFNIFIEKLMNKYDYPADIICCLLVP
jgi:hypothetical protein